MADFYMRGQSPTLFLGYFFGAAAGAAAGAAVGVPPTLAFLSPEWPWKVRVGANSPSL